MGGTIRDVIDNAARRHVPDAVLIGVVKAPNALQMENNAQNVRR
jgi:hypothetical protein